MHPPGKYLLHWGSFGARCAPKPAAQGRTPPRTQVPMKICSATRHPLQGRGSPCEEMPEQRLGQWQTRREGKKTLAIFCRFLFNLETKSSFV